MAEFQIVVCELGGELYGLEISRVYEIIRFQPATAVPQAPAFVDGVINLRGRIIPVVDLAARFGASRSATTKATRIVVAETAGTRVGLIVDGVTEVLMITDDAVEETPEVVDGADSQLIRGIAKLDGCLVILLELDRLFGASEAALLSRAA